MPDDYECIGYGYEYWHRWDIGMDIRAFQNLSMTKVWELRNSVSNQQNYDNADNN